MSAQDDNTATIEAPPQEVAADPVAETPQAEAVETEAPEAEEADEGQERDEKGRFKPNRVQERIDELRRKAGESEREAAYWRGVAEAAKPKEAAPAPAEDPGKPKAADFETYDEYIEKLTDWKIEQREAAQSAKQQQEAQASTWQQRAAAAKAAMPDFDSVLSSSRAPMTQAMAEVIRGSEHGPALAYHLAKNPAEAERLAGLSPHAAAHALGVIEARLSTPTAAPVTPPKKVTSAPPPPSTVGSGRSFEGDPANMSQRDYEAWANAQRKQK